MAPERAGPQFLTLREANALLPRIEALFREMDGHVARGREAAELLEDLQAYWGEALDDPGHPEAGEAARLRARVEAARAATDACLRRIHGLGGHVKSYESGLVDFYARRDGRTVFLCWQRGEAAVQYYHEVEAGFAGRKPLRS